MEDNSPAPEGCYQIIHDEAQIRQFYQIHLQQYEEKNHLSFLILLMCRRKYFPESGITRTLLDRRTFSTKGYGSREDRFVQILRQYEVAEGLYRDKKNNLTIPLSGLALYMTCDPLLEMAAWTKTQTEINQRQQKMLNQALQGDPIEPPLKMNIETVFRDRLHASPSGIYRKLDVDTKDDQLITILIDFLKENQIKPELVIESNGGYHVVINQKNGIGIKKETHRVLYDFAKANQDWISIEKNALVIVPGTLQGGFPTRLVDWGL